MLKEIQHVRQINGEPARRWFSDEFFDLIVWFDNEGITGFQLCYDIRRDERALTWRKGHGYTHDRIDQGEARPEMPGMRKSTPILVIDGIFDYKNIAVRFKEESKEIDSTVAEFVYKRILHYK